MHVRRAPSPAAPSRWPPLTPPRSVEAASTSDVHQTVQDAHAAFQSGVWSRASTQHRSTVLARLARTLEARIPELAEIETLQTGRAIREMRAQLGRLPEWL